MAEAPFPRQARLAPDVQDARRVNSREARFRRPADRLNGLIAGFGGEVATWYSKYRRGYDPSVIDWLADSFALDGDAIVVDLGCGTGELAIPISARPSGRGHRS